VAYSPGIASDFKAELDLLGASKYFIVSDKVISDLGLVKRVVDGLESTGIQVTGVFLDVPPNSEVKAVNACAEQAKASGAEGLIAVGGGSVIDTAKAANILICRGRSCRGPLRRPDPDKATEPFGCNTNYCRHRQRGNHGSGYL